MIVQFLDHGNQSARLNLLIDSFGLLLRVIVRLCFITQGL